MKKGEYGKKEMGKYRREYIKKYGVCEERIRKKERGKRRENTEKSKVAREEERI